jgi:PAS domain S-box-containing protein
LSRQETTGVDGIEALRERIGQEEAEAGRRKVEAMLESITDAFYALDHEWRFTYVNREAVRLLRQPREELLGASLLDAFPGARDTVAYREFRRAERDGVAASFEFFFEPLHGWFNVHAYPGPDGLSVFFRDITERKQADEAARKSEARYRTLFNAIDEGFCIIQMLFDEEGRPVDYRFLESNPAWEEHTGLRDALGRTARELIPDLEEHWFEIYGRVALTGEPVRFEQGSEVMGRWFDVFAFRVEEPEDGMVALLFSDITEQKRAEHRERVFSRMVEESRAEVFVFDAETLRFLRVNRGARENLGYSMEELSRLTLLDLKPELTPESFARLVAPLRRGERGEVRFETVHRRKDGSRYPVDVHLQHFSGGAEPVFVALVLDVTERKLAEARERQLIREQAARDVAEAGRRDAELLAGFSYSLSTSLDREQTLRTVTGALVPALADWCVVEVLADDGDTEHVVAAADPRKEALLRRMLDRYSHDTSMAWVSVREVVGSGRSVLQEEISADMLDRSVPDEPLRDMLRELDPTSAVTVPLLTRDRVRGVISLGSAGSGRRLEADRVALVEELARRTALALDNALLFERERRARVRAAAAVRSRDEVLAVVAHDLRSPLSAISIFASLLENSVSSEEQRQNAGTILRTAEQMDRLIQDLLDIARIEGGFLHIEREPHEPMALIGEVVDVLQEKAAARGIRLQGGVSSAVPALAADPYRIRQVLSNLVENAIKVTPRGGSVRLTANARGDEIVFSVRDTGPGISQAQLPKLFERFWQARRDDRTGTGLGLAIARGIVEAHGGRIWAESEPGAGSTFSFSLCTADQPAAPQPVATAPGVRVAAPASDPVPSEPIRVLLSDDHPFVLRGLDQTLRKIPGIRIVAEAGTGEEALEKAEATRPDVVVIDLAMKGIGGLEAIRQLTDRWPQVRVLALTSDAEEESLLAVLAAGGHGFVRKTQAHETLAEAIATVARDEVYLYPSAARLLLQGFRVAEQRATEPIERLSAQERKLLRLLAEGYASKEIAKKLFLARSTVDTYRAQLMNKLGLRHRSELVKFALRHGLLEAD